MSLGGFADHGLAAMVIIVGYLVAGVTHFEHARKMLFRMRWLFLSLLIVYFWFTPGTSLIPAWSEWTPSIEGVVTGVLRMLTLVLLVLAVSLLIQATPRESMVSAIIWLLSPMRVIGISTDRFAVRLMLTLEKVTEVQDLYGEQSRDISVTEGKFSAYGRLMLGLFQNVIERSEQSVPKDIKVPEQSSPVWYQWLFPVGLGLGFFLL